MKKIMFNDGFLLTKAVLDGRKTQTRRIVRQTVLDKVKQFQEYYYEATFDKLEGTELLTHYFFVEKYRKLPYNVGEVVAVVQSYKDIYNEEGLETMDMIVQGLKNSEGWNNKMFVAADKMIHQIHITDVRVERLQDISDECCLKEGIIKKWHAPACKNYYYVPGVEVKSVKDVYDTPQEAFAHLINKVSRKDVWKENPYVFVYNFELLK